MSKRLSFDLEMNAQGFKQGINEAKGATAEYTNATKDLKKETDDYLKSFGSLRKQFGAAKKEAQNLAAQFAALGEAEKNSEYGQELAESLDIAIRKAAELQDVMGDTNQAIKNAASDTQGWDAMKDSFEIGKDLATAYAGAVAKLTGNEKALKDLVANVAMVQGAANAAIKIGNALQKQSNIMIALGNVQLKAKATAESLATKNTIAATAAQRVFNAVAKANPYVLLATVAVTAATAIGGYMLATKKAGDEEKKAAAEAERSAEIKKKATEAYNSTSTELIFTYNRLQQQWKLLRTEADKIQWIKDNKSEFDKLGISINNVTDAENVLINNSADMVEAFNLRAQAAAHAARAQERYMESLTLEDKFNETAAKWNERIANAKGFTGTSQQQERAMLIKQRNEELALIQKEIDAQKELSEEETKREIELRNRASSLVGKYQKHETNNNDNNNNNNNDRKNTTEVPEYQVDKLLPSMSLVNNDIKQWFKDFDNKIKTEAQKSFNKQKVEFKVNLNANIDKQQIDDVVNESERKTEDILSTIKSGEGFKDQFDFSFLSDGAYEEATRLKEQLDSTLDEMTDIFNQFGNTEEAQAGIAALCDQYDVLVEKLKAYQKENKKNKTFATIAEGAKDASNYLGNLGSAFSQLGDATENAGIKAVGIILETLANLALSFSQAMIQAASMGPWAWIAFGISGMAQLAAMISQIKGMVSGGFAEGGVIPGSSYVGDKLLARVNSGERVLTQEQNENFEKIANGVGYYQDGREYTISSVGVSGRDLVLVLQNELKVTGKKTIL